MLNFIDNLINGITMYRLMLYYLGGLLLIAAVLSTFGILSFGVLPLIISISVITAACVITNTIFAKVFEVTVNLESAYITAFILALIITPPVLFDPAGFWFLIWVSIWAMASKFMFTIKRKHIFNPAAFAVALTALTINQAATWWVATVTMVPFVIIGGILVTRKIRHFDLILSFFISAVVAIVVPTLFNSNSLVILAKTIVVVPLFFLGFAMLSDPLTTPHNRKLRIMYGILVGVLFSPKFHIGPVYSTPEFALLIGNAFSYFVSPKPRYLLKLKEKIPYGNDTYDFVFQPSQNAEFKPGQYLEWTLGHRNPDNRGNRRYFTIASSPTEPEVHLGVKFYPKPSSYKKALLAMKKDDVMHASQLSGDFTLTPDKKQKLVFIAGGIGITPFRSMIKYLLDINEPRSIVLFYSNKLLSEIAYKNIFDQAEQQLGMKTIYTLTDANSCPIDWKGCKGHLDEKLIEQEVPDYKERLFYISGTHAMVVNYQNVLKKLGVKRNQIKVDFFPGF